MLDVGPARICATAWSIPLKSCVENVQLFRTALRFDCLLRTSGPLAAHPEPLEG
jgi:hypothetical protein